MAHKEKTKENEKRGLNKEEEVKETIPFEDRRITASIYSFERGLEVYKNVKLVRVKSDKYNMLIMVDHTPTLGEVKGNVTILCDDEEYIIKNVIGYFSLIHNEFHFIEKGTFEPEVVEEAPIQEEELVQEEVKEKKKRFRLKKEEKNAESD